MFKENYLLAILFTCITFVGIVAGAKIAGMTDDKLSMASSVGTSLRAIDQGPKTDPSFFNSVTDEKVPIKANTKAPAPTKPYDPVQAEAYIVGDISTGKIYLEKNSTKVYPFASMSKLITALVAEDNYPLDKTIEITSDETQVAPDASNLQAGEKFALNELFYPLLLNSSNVAAEAIASSSDRREFLELMSSYSWEIGMPQAYFADPSGLSDRNAGTAEGFFAMAQYLYEKKPQILALTRVAHMSIATTTLHGSHEFVNIHPFVTDSRFLGGKTGHTSAALDTMLTILDISGHPIAIIVLRSPYRRAEDTTLLADKVAKIIQ